MFGLIYPCRRIVNLKWIVGEGVMIKNGDKILKYEENQGKIRRDRIIIDL